VLPNRAGGRSAIEVHTPGPGVINNNIVEGFQYGLVVAGSNVQIFENAIKRVNFGIFMSALERDNGIDNVDISGNAIAVAQVQHDQMLCGGIVMTPDKDYTGPYSNVSITNNRISYESDERNRSGLAYNSTNGIGLNPPGSISNITVTDNAVAGAPLRGMTIGNMSVGSSRYTHIVVKHNSFTNCGQDIGMGQFFRSGIQLVGNLTDVAIVGNSIVDRYRALHCYYSFSCGPGTYKNVLIKGNVISSESGKMFAILKPGVTADLR